MECQAKTIKTPVGNLQAPLNPHFKEQMQTCNDKYDLFKLVDVNNFICPDAFNEVVHRGLYQEYLNWVEYGKRLKQGEKYMQTGNIKSLT